MNNTSTDTKPVQAKNITNNDEIDLIVLAKTLWGGRRKVIKFILVGMAVGLVFAFLSPKEYTASTTMIPQTGSSLASKLGGLSSLASLAGVNMNVGADNDALPPTIYPQIIESIPFQLELMNDTFQCPEVAQPVSLYDYFSKYKKKGVLGDVQKYTVGLPGLIVRALKGEKKTSELIHGNSLTQLYSLTEEQDKIRGILSESVQLEINEDEGYLTLSARFNDALLAAQVARKTQTMLQEYITRYKLEKANEQLKFVEARYKEKKAEFEEIQQELATFRDRNKNITTATASTQLEQLQSQYNLVYSVYSELGKQVEQAQIQVKEDTPILTIIEPVRVPLQKTKPKRLLIIMIWTFLGGFIGMGMVLGRDFVDSIKEKWNAK